MILFKLKFLLIVGGLAIGALFALLFFVTVFISDEETESGTTSSEGWNATGVSNAVLEHQQTVEKYAKAHDIEGYVPMILALMEVESGGEAEDVMQSSESLGLPVNSLDTEASIEQGVKYVSELLDTAEDKGVDDETVIQSYNFGAGFIDYVAERDGAYSLNWQNHSRKINPMVRKLLIEIRLPKRKTVGFVITMAICSMWIKSISI